MAWSDVESHIVYLVDFLVVLGYNWLTDDVVPYFLFEIESPVLINFLYEVKLI